MHKARECLPREGISAVTERKGKVFGIAGDVKEIVGRDSFFSADNFFSAVISNLTAFGRDRVGVFSHHTLHCGKKKMVCTENNT